MVPWTASIEREVTLIECHPVWTVVEPGMRDTHRVCYSAIYSVWLCNHSTSLILTSQIDLINTVTRLNLSDYRYPLVCLPRQNNTYRLFP